MNDFDMFNFLKGFQTETKEEITNKYIQGLISKDEFIKRMNSLNSNTEVK